MNEIIIISLIAWWISEGSNLIEDFKWYFKLDRLYILDCPKCLGFWMGTGYVLFIGLSADTLPIPILCSAGAMFVSKIYSRL